MKQSEWEQQMYKIAYECAIKGIDIEETLGNFINTYEGVFDIIIKQTNKNYDYLLKCREPKEEPKEELEELEEIELIDIHYVNDKCIFKVYGQSIEETIAIKVNELIDEVNKLKKERIRNNK